MAEKHSTIWNKHFIYSFISWWALGLFMLACIYVGIHSQANRLQWLALTNHHGGQLCRGLPHKAGFTSAAFWCLLIPPLECDTVEVFGWFNMVWNLCWLWGLPGGPWQGQLPRVFWPGPPGVSYKVFCRWLLLVLGLEAYLLTTAIAADAWPRATQQEIWGTLRSDMLVWEILEK